MVDEINIGSDRFLSRNDTGIELRSENEQAGAFLNYSSGHPRAEKHLVTKNYTDAASKGVYANLIVFNATTDVVDIGVDIEIGDDIDGTGCLDFVLVKDQSDLTENGVYIPNTFGPATRLDASMIKNNTVVFVETGTTNLNKFYKITGSFTGTAGSPNYGIDDITVTEIDIAALPIQSGVPAGGTTNQVLTKASNADGDAEWATISPSGSPIGVPDLTDVTLTSLTIGDLFKWDGTRWVNGRASLSLLSDAFIDSPGTGQALVWSGTDWQNTSISLSGLNDVDITGGNTYPFLTFDGSKWVDGTNRTISDQVNRLAYYDISGFLTYLPSSSINNQGCIDFIIDVEPNGTDYFNQSYMATNVHLNGTTNGTEFRNVQAFQLRIDPDGSGGEWMGGARVLDVNTDCQTSANTNGKQNINSSMTLGDGTGGSSQYLQNINTYAELKNGYEIQNYNALNGGVDLRGSSSANFICVSDFYVNSEADSAINVYSPYRAFGNLLGTVDAYIGVELGPQFKGGVEDFTAFRSNPNFYGTNNTYYTGLNLEPQWDGTGIAPEFENVTGIRVKLNNVSQRQNSGRMTGLQIEGGTVNTMVDVTTQSNIFFDSVENQVIQLLIAEDETISGTEVLLKNYANLIQIEGTYSSGPLGLGIVGQLAGGQLGGTGDGLADKVTIFGAGVSVPDLGASSTRVDQLTVYRSLGAFTLGGTLDIGELVHFKVDDENIMNLGTARWGIQINDSEANNFFRKNVVVGGTSKTTATASVAIEIGDKRAMKFTPMNISERDALTAEEGMMVYVRDGTVGGMFVYDGTTWNAM